MTDETTDRGFKRFELWFVGASILFGLLFVIGLLLGDENQHQTPETTSPESTPDPDDWKTKISDRENRARRGRHN